LTLPTLQPIAPGTQRYKLELGRAQRLFGARQYTAARSSFVAVRSAASGDERELVGLRLAECEYFLKQPRNARDGVRPFLDHASRQGEALFFYALAQRDLGNDAEYLQAVRRVVTEFPEQSWREEALNNLATYYIVRDQDDEADAVFRDLYDKNPQGSYADRAALKIGWRAYRKGQYQDTVRYFERAASNFPRSDYRPVWLYWSARAHEQLDEISIADQRYALVMADYLNSYYGRLAAKRLGERAPANRTVMVPVSDGEDGPPVARLPSNASIVRALLDAGLYDDALNELRFAQRIWGDSAPVQATVAWIHQQQARSESGTRRFELLRGAITTMRRAYPQFMAAGGEDLPRDVLTVIFPIAYWDLIRRYSAANSLDPFFVAALVAQESTFVADIRSHANAYGLMQLMPATARQYARKLNLRYSTRLLTDPETNIRMGTAYLADKIRQFGDPHLVLASYNAGESAVRRWMSERPGIERDEFIDDIPYPETQGYVKKILGTAEDYRRLYGGESSRVDDLTTTAKSAPPRVGAAPSKKAPAKKAPAKRPASKKRRT
jgi:soluble lytic murein transglycosylase